MSISKNIVIAFIATVFLSPLHGMDNSVSIDNAMIVWKVVLDCGVKLFNYKMISSLVVSTSHDQLLCDTAQNRKNYFVSKEPYLGVIDDIIWNKYGSVCAYVSLFEPPSYCSFWDGWHGYMPCQREQEILITSRKLSKKSLPHYASWDNFHACLLHKPSAVFTSGGIAFHGYGNMLCYGDEQSGNVMEYKLSFLGKNSTATCITRIKGKEIPLSTFLEFPSLLKAFLDSSVTAERFSQSVFHDKIKVYSIQGVTIPDDYQKHEGYFPVFCYKEFSALPKFIGKVITAQYKSQHKVQPKKKKKRIACFG